MKYLLALCIALISCKKVIRNIYFSGTSIIIVRTPTGFLVAADTRRVINESVGGKEFTLYRYDTVCKIHKHGHLFFSSSGTNTVSIDSIASSCIKDNLSFLEIANKILISGHQYRKHYLENIKTNSPNDYKHYFNELRYLQFALYGYEDKIPKIYRIDFIIKSSPDQKVDLCDSVYKSLSKPTDNEAAFLGHHENMYRIINDNKNFWKENGLAKGAYALISAEVSADSIHVGKPIDILGIFKDTCVWALKSGRCKFCP